MKTYTKEDVASAKDTIQSIILNCERTQPKFKEGSSQFSLLKNRIKAMYIIIAIIDKQENSYTIDEMQIALKPICSIISKCEKAQSKFDESNHNFRRLDKIIKAMGLSKTLLEETIQNFNV